MGGLPRQALFQKSGQGGADGTEPAQRDGHNGARQGDVAWFQTAKPRKYRRARKAFVERMISSDNIVQDRCGGDTRGKTWAILSLAPMVLRGNDIAWPAVRNLAATPPVCRRKWRSVKRETPLRRLRKHGSYRLTSTNIWTLPRIWAKFCAKLWDKFLGAEETESLGRMGRILLFRSQ